VVPDVAVRVVEAVLLVLVPVIVLAEAVLLVLVPVRILVEAVLVLAIQVVRQPVILCLSNRVSLFMMLPTFQYRGGD
jgi:hypothetical protein